MGRVAVPVEVAGACFTTPPPRWVGSGPGRCRVLYHAATAMGRGEGGEKRSRGGQGTEAMGRGEGGGGKRSGYTLLRDNTTVEAIIATSAAAIQIHCVPCAWNFSPRTT